jgi:hypothetical protein
MVNGVWCIVYAVCCMLYAVCCVLYAVLYLNGHLQLRLAHRQIHCNSIREGDHDGAEEVVEPVERD